MHSCACLCACTRVRIYVHACVCVSTCPCLFLCMHLCVCVCLCVRMHECMSGPVHARAGAACGCRRHCCSCASKQPGTEAGKQGVGGALHMPTPATAPVQEHQKVDEGETERDIKRPAHGHITLHGLLMKTSRVWARCLQPQVLTGPAQPEHQGTAERTPPSCPAQTHAPCPPCLLAASPQRPGSPPLYAPHPSQYGRCPR